MLSIALHRCGQLLANSCNCNHLYSVVSSGHSHVAATSASNGIQLGPRMKARLGFLWPPYGAALRAKLAMASMISTGNHAGSHARPHSYTRCGFRTWELYPGNPLLYGSKPGMDKATHAGGDKQQ